jgi:hypothetical protein
LSSPRASQARRIARRSDRPGAIVLGLIRLASIVIRLKQADRRDDLKPLP